MPTSGLSYGPCACDYRNCGPADRVGRNHMGERMRVSRLLAAAVLTALAAGIAVQLGESAGQADSPAQLGYININTQVIPSQQPA